MSTDEQNSQEGLEMASDTSPGQLLQAGRLKAGLSVEEAADRLKVPESYILAIESNEFEKLPGLVFARGYVRSYARTLELDGDEAVAHFDGFTGHSSAEIPHLKAGAPVTTRRPMSPAVAWGASLVTVILVGAGSYYGWNMDKRSASDPEGVIQQQAPVVIESTEEFSDVEEIVPLQADFNDSETEVAEPEAESEPKSQVDTLSEETEQPGLAQSAEASGSLVRLAIEFAEDCWVQIMDMSGHALYTDVQRAGSNLELEVPSSVQVRFGNVKGVADLKFDGKEVAVKASGPGRKVAKLVLEAG